MNYTFDKHGWLVLDGFAIHPGLTKSNFLQEKLYERQGDAQAYEYYILEQRLVNRGIRFTVNLVFEGERLHWTEIAREDNKGLHNLSVLTELKDDMLGSGEDKFTWGDLSIPGNTAENKFLLIRYSK